MGDFGRFRGDFGKVSGRFRKGFGEVFGWLRGGFGKVSERFPEDFGGWGGVKIDCGKVGAEGKNAIKIDISQKRCKIQCFRTQIRVT